MTIFSPSSPKSAKNSDPQPAEGTDKRKKAEAPASFGPFVVSATY